MQIDHYIEFTNGKDVVRRVPVEAIPFTKKHFCKSHTESETGESTPLCKNWQRADKCHECVDIARSFYKTNRKSA